MRIFLMICFIFILFAGIQSDEVTNSDLPEKGEWSFSAQKDWETDTAGKELLIDIGSIRIDDSGNIYLFNRKLNRVHVFDPMGENTVNFGRTGEGPGEIKDGFGLFLSGDRVIVPDLNKTHYFSREGKYLNSIKTPEMFIPYLFLDAHRVLASPLSSFRKEERELVLFDLEKETKKELFRFSKVNALRYSGKDMRLLLRMPFEVAEELLMVKNSGGAWYGYNNTYKIHKLDLSGQRQYTFSIKQRQREPLSRRDKSRLAEKVMDTQTEVPKNILAAMTSQIPDHLPYFHHLFSDKNGLLYVWIACSKTPHIRHVDIFSKNGKYLFRGSVSIDEDCFFVTLAMRDTTLVAFIEDPDGERKLVKYSLKIPI
jgi:hypothetical protein